MRRRLCFALIGATAAASVALAAPALATPDRSPTRPGPQVSARPTLSVIGDVAAPARYTARALAAQPVLTLPSRRGQVSGVSVEALVDVSQPKLPDTKNALLGALVTVSAGPRSETFALGELDTGFGDNPALITTQTDRRTHRVSFDLVVPGDRTTSRTLDGITGLRVSVVTAAVPTPAPGAIVVRIGHRAATVPARVLARLAARTITVSFLSGSSPQTHTEHGPSLATVLAWLHVRSGPNTWVAGFGDDGYLAAVTPAEQRDAGKQLLISTAEDGAALAEPRLVVGGDVKGGRYVSGLVGLVVSPGG